MSSVALAKAKAGKEWRNLDRKVAQAKALIRSMRETIQDIEDARLIEQVKKANGNKPRIPWAKVKQELGLDF